MPKTDNSQPLLLKTWVIPSSATLGSTVRIKGIVQEIRARLAPSLKKMLTVDGAELELIMPVRDKLLFNATAALVSKVVSEADTLPIIPREIEDILGIKTSERKRWLEDGRLPSAGTRTVKLRGRAKKITFHVFDPKNVQDLLEQGLVEEWREADIESAAENRQRAAYKAKLTRSLKKAAKSQANDGAAKEVDGAALSDWEEFARDGFLR